MRGRRKSEGDASKMVVNEHVFVFAPHTIWCHDWQCWRVDQHRVAAGSNGFIDAHPHAARVEGPCKRERRAEEGVV